jgi:hypothetical protein
MGKEHLKFVRIKYFYSFTRPVVGKHPDLLVGPPTAPVFPTNDQNFERSQFFEKNFEKI